MSLITRGMGTTEESIAVPLVQIVESIEGVINKEDDVKATIKALANITGTVEEQKILGKKTYSDSVKGTIVESERIKGKVNE